ncbi:hypothetical protein [uncultured Roseobacter sp.]|uniref:hypothetical protein n=1 Tax=uncultured Roseobacter sp. TaxID=114847 RepID=UPI00260749F9|nr:hypothetical protein [uncultured Roseobacter sp.]
MTPTITLQDVDAYIERIRASGAMGKSERRLRLLEHLAKAEVLDKGDQLKAYTIALDIFDKSEDFDPSTDSIVRVEVGRLRTAIAVFEASTFADTDIRIDIPVGTYRPSITHRATYTPTAQIAAEPRATRQRKSNWWTVAVTAIATTLLWIGWLEFYAPRQDPAENAIAVQIDDLKGSDQSGQQAGLILRRVLARNKAITVLSAPEDAKLHPHAEFVLRGAILEVDDQKQASVELINAQTSRTVWAKSVALQNGERLEETLAKTIGNELRVRLFGVTKNVLEGRDPNRLSPEQLFVMATWVPGPATNAVEWELERIELMQMALEKSPEFGAAHSVLADKLAYLANVYGPSDTPALRDQAHWHAQRALELAPLDPDVMFNVAQSQWHSGHIHDSEQTMRRVVALDRSHDLARFLALVIPYTCRVAPDDTLAEAIGFDANLSPDNPIRWLTLTWIAWLHLHREEYSAALEAETEAALIFQIPYTFMRRAVLLNKLGRPDAAADVIRSQQVNWPDISPEHFAKVTIPRLCSEEDSAAPFIENYVTLAKAMTPRL